MNKFIFGFHSITAHIKANPLKTAIIYVSADRNDRRLQELLHLAKGQNIAINECSNDKLNSLTSKTTKHQGVVAEIVASRDNMTLEEFLASTDDLKSGIVLILDGVTDPQNLGAIIRTADCFGVCGIIIPKDNSASADNDVVAKVSSGAVHHLPIIVVNNISRAMEKLKEKEFWIAGTVLDDKAVDLFEFKPTNKIAWVMGSENCDYYVTIPLYGKTQSLNVSVATGVVLSYTKNAIK
jgi:23S rRNA (guanosine2251-2'-O)-methyltransferase